MLCFARWNRSPRFSVSMYSIYRHSISICVCVVFVVFSFFAFLLLFYGWGDSVPNAYSFDDVKQLILFKFYSNAPDQMHSHSVHKIFLRSQKCIHQMASKWHQIELSCIFGHHDKNQNEMTATVKTCYGNNAYEKDSIFRIHWPVILPCRL